MESSTGPLTLQGPGWEETFVFRSMHLLEMLSEPFHYEVELLSDDPNQDPAEAEQLHRQAFRMEHGVEPGPIVTPGPR